MDSNIHVSDSYLNNEEIEVWPSSLQEIVPNTDNIQSDEIFIDNLVNDTELSQIYYELETENISFPTIYEEICKETLSNFGIEEATYLQTFEIDNNSNSSEIASTFAELNAHQPMQMSSISTSEKDCSSSADVHIPSEDFNVHQSLQISAVTNSESGCSSNGDVHIPSEELNDNQSLQIFSVSYLESGCTSNTNAASTNSRNTCINQETNSETSNSLKINNANKENTDNRKQSLRNNVLKRKRLSEKTNIDPKNKKAKNDKDQLSEDMKQQRREAQSKATRKNLIKKKANEESLFQKKKDLEKSNLNIRNEINAINEEAFVMCNVLFQDLKKIRKKHDDAAVTCGILLTKLNNAPEKQDLIQQMNKAVEEQLEAAESCRAVWKVLHDVKASCPVLWQNLEQSKEEFGN